MGMGEAAPTEGTQESNACPEGQLLPGSAAHGAVTKSGPNLLLFWNATGSCDFLLWSLDPGFLL